MFDSKEDTLWRALDQYVMALDEDLGYDIPREELKTAVINFVENYFNDSATAAEYAAKKKGRDRLVSAAISLRTSVDSANHQKLR